MSVLMSEEERSFLITLTSCSERNRCLQHKIMILQGIEVVLAVTLFIIFLMLFDFSKPISEISKPNVTKNPNLVWITEYDKDTRLFFVPTDQISVNCSSGFKFVQCDVTGLSRHPAPADGYLFYATCIQTLPLPRNAKTLWGLLHEESPRNLVDLMHEPFLSLFNFTSTFSRYSDVPMPLIWMRDVEDITDTTYFVNTSIKTKLLSELAPVLYMQSDCDTSTERDEYVKKLMEYIPIDSYGLCLNNKKFSKSYDHFSQSNDRHYLRHLHSSEILHFIAKYKFIIAIENGVCNDYVTEKFWRSIQTGVVPIYYGDPLIRDWLPNNKSAILLEDFPTPLLMSQHLYELLRNDSKYEEYLDHKTKGLISNQKIFKEMEARPEQTDFMANIHSLYCLMCERVHAKNDTRINMANKKHYDCPLPTSALTLSVNPENPWMERIKKAKSSVDNLLLHLDVRGFIHRD